MKIFNVCFLLVLSLFLFQCAENEKIPPGHVGLEIKLHGKSYEQLYLYTWFPTQPDSTWVAKMLPGQSTDGYNWLFIVPDSINNLAEDGYNIKSQLFNFEKNEDKMFAFIIDGLPKSKRRSRIYLSDKKTIIECTYLGEEKEYKEGWDILIPDTFVTSPNICFEYFEYVLNNKKKYTDTELSLIYPDFDNLPVENYEKELQERIDLVTQYPESNYLFNSLGYSVGYKNNEDMKLVFDRFSKKLQSSDLGERIQSYLSKKIIPEDINQVQLINSKTNKPESVVINKAKPTLVVFSASWCGPCHKLIPVLKEIYDENSVNMVYISMDGASSIDNWKELMEKENIPWRSLIAGDKHDGLSEKYSIRGIPHAILIDGDSITKVNVLDWKSLSNHNTHKQ